ncbi:MAG: family 43 glycosylhydrolase, partial [Acidobacteria bacterium]|nr:family 43 glycosylhydrolase [Acidobacteriota bacterium]
MLKKQKLKFQVFGLVLLVLICLSAQILAQKSATYTNPVQAGDYPDPSVIRVGKNFYATATSSEWGPEFPILHSRDLVNWNIVGVVFPKRPEWSVGNYWAPEIWQENGKFYIFYVARRKDGPLCIAVATAAKPTGPYTDHGALECQEVGSIDAFPIRDENGKLFVVWKEDGNSVNKPTP